MSRYLSLSRAAKLVGVSRGEIQKLVSDNKLQSFEGQVSLDELEKLFPQAELGKNAIVEDMERIIEQAMKRARGEKLAKLLAPDPYVLSSRLQVLSREQARNRNQLNAMQQLCRQLQQKLEQLMPHVSDPKQLQDINRWISDSVEDIMSMTSQPAVLREKDNILRVMAAQVHIKNSGHEYFVEGNNSILEAGLSAGLALNYGCSNGNCGKCKARLLSGEIKNIKHHDYSFSENEKLQQYFLTCCNTAVTDIIIDADEAGNARDIPRQKITAKVKKIETINESLRFLNLKTPRTKRLRFLAGQRVTLKYKELPSLSLPVASCPCDDMNIQFHVPFSDHPLVQQIFDSNSKMDSIALEGPEGEFVLDDNSNSPIVFIAFDCGFAPIKSLIEHAITLEHASSIQLLWLHSGDKPYMHNQCRAWEDAIDNFTYQYQHYDEQDIEQLDKKLYILFKDSIDLADKDIFICGNEDVVLRTHDYLGSHQIDGKRIHTDIL